MKKTSKCLSWLTALLMLLAACICFSGPVLAADQLPPLSKSAVFTIGSRNVTVDGQVYQIDVAPYIDANGRTMLPARYVGEVLGCAASWDPATGTVTLTHLATTLRLVIGSSILTSVSGTSSSEVTMNTRAVVIPPGRTMIPVRFVAQALGYTVEWNSTGKTVTLEPVAGTVSTTPPAAGSGGGGSAPGPAPAVSPAVTAASIALNGVPVPAVTSGTTGTITLSGSADAMISDPTISVSTPCLLTISVPAELAGQTQQLSAGENTLSSLAGLMAQAGQSATLGNLYDLVQAATGGNTFSISGTLTGSGGSTPISLTVILNVH